MFIAKLFNGNVEQKKVHIDCESVLSAKRKASELLMQAGTWFNTDEDEDCQESIVVVARKHSRNDNFTILLLKNKNCHCYRSKMRGTQRRLTVERGDALAVDGYMLYPDGQVICLACQ